MKKQQIWLFKIIKHSFFWIAVSVMMMIGSIVLFIVNARLSIEFTGGIDLTINKLNNEENLVSALKDGLTAQGFNQPQINIEKEGTNTSLLVSLPFENDEQVKEVSSGVNQILLNQWFISSPDAIVGLSLNGPSVSSYMKSGAINAIIVGLILISIYIMFSFASVRKHISPLVLGWVTILTMLFDTSIALWAYGLWMAFNSTVTVDTIFIISILTIMGYSINDTIIILDRIRENIARQSDSLDKGTVLYGQLVEDSIWQTMRRSLGTGVTTLLVTLTMFIFGTDMLQKFAFTIAIGIIAGTYSSLFFASPMTYIFLNKWKKELKKL